MSVKRILIAGGGIGGLSLGIGLQKSGFQVTVVERSKELRQGGSGIVLSPNGLKALEYLEPKLLPKVVAVGCVSGAEKTGHKTHFFSHQGKCLAQFSFDGMQETWGAPVVSILRRRLMRVLQEEALACGLDFIRGARVLGFEQDETEVRLFTEDAEPLHGDLLVGADGLRSAVRKGLLDDGDPNYCGYTAIRGVGPRPTEYPDGFIIYGKGSILFVSPVDERDACWVLSTLSPRGIWKGKTKEDAFDFALDRLSDWNPEFVEIVQKSSPETFVLTDVFDRRSVNKWFHERVVLLGDAAHPMVYTMGQGANVTLEDAAILTHQLAQHNPLSESLSQYQTSRAPRSAKITRQSRMMGSIGHSKNPLKCWFRNTMMKMMSKFGDPTAQNAPVFGWEPPVRCQKGEV